MAAKKTKPDLGKLANDARHLAHDITTLLHASGTDPVVRLALENLSDKASRIASAIESLGGKSQPIPGTAGYFLADAKKRRAAR